jgi:hypothetical protein
MSSLYRFCRSLASLPQRAGVLRGYGAAVPAVLAAALARPPGWHTHPRLPPGWASRPHLPPGWNKHPPPAAHLYPAAVGGMPGWRISQLTAAAVLLAVAVAVTVYRLRAARRRAGSTTA